MKLYRAEDKVRGVKLDWIPENEAWGRWYTDSKEEAELYLRDFVGEEEGNIVVLDMSEEEALKYRIDNLPKDHPARRYSKKHTIEYFVPKSSLAAKTILLR
jgi:hypothetical protein